MARIIIHVDMDYFFAAVEERGHPEWKNKPVVVGADPKGGKGRGVVSTCNYTARKFGVHSGMPISQAWRACQSAVFLPVNFELYQKVSGEIMAILRKYADSFEQVSIDEAFLDVSSLGSFDRAKKVAQDIKNEVMEREKLTCSVGIGPNKLVAKIAAGFKKPAGLTVVLPNRVRDFLWPLEVRKLWGVGPVTAERLKKLRIATIGDLAKADVSKLIEELGQAGFSFHQMANGLDTNPVHEIEEAKSFSREVTFAQDTSDAVVINKTLQQISNDVHQDVVGNDVFFKSVAIKVRYDDFETHTRQTSVKPTNDVSVIADIAKELMKPFLQNNKKIRLVGVKVSDLVHDRKQKSVSEFFGGY